MRLENQVALVTGGASGLGLAVAKALVLRKAKVIIWDKSVAQEGESLPFFSCDVRQEQEVEEALALTIKEVGTPRILVHCAGIAPANRVMRPEGPMPLEAFREVIDVNLLGTFNVMRVVAHAMMSLPLEPLSQERGVIITTASIAAYEGQIGQVAYSASKGGVIAMTLPAAREFASFAIRVNTIAPGVFTTPMVLGMPILVQESLASTSVFPKRLGKPQEFAQLALHIVENTMLNGEVIRLDGALRMPP